MTPDFFAAQRRQLDFAEEYFRPAEPPERYQYEDEEDEDNG